MARRNSMTELTDSVLEALQTGLNNSSVSELKWAYDFLDGDVAVMCQTFITRTLGNFGHADTQTLINECVPIIQGLVS